MATSVQMRHRESGVMKTGYFGFSWTSFFFGGFPALFRGDIAYGLAFLITAFMAAIASAGLMWFVATLIWAFVYNSNFTKRLLEKGYVFSDNPERNSEASFALGVASPVSTETKNTGTAICKSCKNEISTNVNFCSVCGEAVKPAANKSSIKEANGEKSELERSNIIGTLFASLLVLPLTYYSTLYFIVPDDEEALSPAKVSAPAKNVQPASLIKDTSKSPSAQKDRLQIILKFVKSGYIQKIDTFYNPPRIYVTRLYKMMPLKAPYLSKESLAEIAFSYHNHKNPDIKKLLIHDSVTGEELGNFSSAGLVIDNSEEYKSPAPDKAMTMYGEDPSFLMGLKLDEKAQAKRRDDILTLKKTGYVPQIEIIDKLPYMHVTPRFRAEDSGHQELLASMVFIYHFTQNPAAQMVFLKDSITGKEIGKYSPDIGLQMRS